ncbi:MAG: TIGR03936 family radical SAM-associated protein [Eubacteriales bacterium]|nr:TIGR03936 family radical SAM-associated protein [Eubacteriales bacterium]
MKIVFKYTKLGKLKFISHLDNLRVLQRALRRTGIMAKYSEGFNPHPKLSIAYPLSLGVESIGEIAEVEVIDDINISEFIDKMNKCLPDGMAITEASEYADNRAVPSMVCSQVYRFTISHNDQDSVDAAINSLKGLLDNDYPIIREKKKKNKIVKKEMNLTSFIQSIDLLSTEMLDIDIQIVIHVSDTGSLKVEEVKDFLYNSLNGVKSIEVQRIALNFIDKVI